MMDEPSMAELQESDYGEGRVYAWGAPHLTHLHLRRRIEGDLLALVHERVAARGECRVVEVGAGHGTFTSALVGAGAAVTVTEMSSASAKVLLQRFANVEAVTVTYDPDGDRAIQAVSAGCDLIVFVSVLHHIPDYVDVVRKLATHLRQGGTFYSVQDPIWYADRGRGSRIASQGSYLAWRALQGNIKRGLSTAVRRLRGVYDESKPSDMVEYHVVRDGVDQKKLRDVLLPLFDDVEVSTYWSTQAPILQRIGERIDLRSEFSIKARGRNHGG